MSLPGNDALPVSVGRRLTVGVNRMAAGAFGDWDLEIPHLKGVFARADGWNVGDESLAADRYKRCSRFGVPADPRTQTGERRVPAAELWFGHHLRIPGSGERELLARAAGGDAVPTDGNTYPVVAKDGWVFSCLPTLANGQPGEGFVALTPDGTRYRFDWMVKPGLPDLPRQHRQVRCRQDAPHAPIPRPTPTPTPGPEPDKASPGPVNAELAPLVARNEYWLMPTLVSDRFGNTVRYNFNAARPWQLESIRASDGRTLSLGYLPNSDLVQTVSDGTRTWRYVYTGSALTAVVQPDGSRWQFSAEPLHFNPAYFNAPETCAAAGSFTDMPLTKTMVHPSGAVGTFLTRQLLRGRSFVAPCTGPNVGARNTVHYLVRALGPQDPHRPGPGPPWSGRIAYGPANGSVSPCAGCCRHGVCCRSPTRPTR